MVLVIPPTGLDEAGRATSGSEIKLTGPNASDVGWSLNPIYPFIITKGADATFNLTRTGSTGSVYFELVFI